MSTNQIVARIRLNRQRMQPANHIWGCAPVVIRTTETAPAPASKPKWGNLNEAEIANRLNVLKAA